MYRCKIELKLKEKLLSWEALVVTIPTTTTAAASAATLVGMARAVPSTTAASSSAASGKVLTLLPTLQDLITLRDILGELPGDFLRRRAEKLLQTRRERNIVRCLKKRVGVAVLAVSACSPDAVDVGVELGGHFVVNHVGDIGDVNAAGDDVRCDEEVTGAVLKRVDCPLAVALCKVAVDCHAEHVGRGREGRSDPMLELRENGRRGALSLDEDNRLFGGADDVVLVELHEDFQLGRAIAVSEVDELLNQRVHGMASLVGTRADKEMVLFDILGGQRLDFVVPRRGPHERLRHQLIGAEKVHDIVDLRLESHIEQPIRLVEHEKAARAEVDNALSRKVRQPAGRGDNDLRPRTLPGLEASVLGAAIGVRAPNPEAL